MRSSDYCASGNGDPQIGCGCLKVKGTPFVRPGRQPLSAALAEKLVQQATGLVDQDLPLRYLV